MPTTRDPLRADPGTRASEPPVPTPRTYVGLFLVALATLMHEILLTRIFSVTMWYHFAFVAISVAMFGMTVGAIIVYLRPGFFSPARVVTHLGASALAFAISVVVSFLVYLRGRFEFDASAGGLLLTAVGYLVIAVPFVFSGISVCLALTKFPRQVAALYAADLVGAAIGCLLIVVTLNLTDGPTAVIVVAGLAALSAVCFLAGDRGRLWRAAVLTTALLAAFATLHGWLARQQTPLLRLQWVKGGLEARPLHEKWNSFSRITVFGDPHRPSRPFGWGLSAVAPVGHGARQLMLLIDAGAGTVLTAFDGDWDALRYLKYDVTNLPHYLRRDARVLVVGAGGGRDVLSALAFGQRAIVAVEINQDILRIVNGRFGAFTGHLDRRPEVTFVADEARSYVARQRDRYDIIQISLIDTWAATAAGAFVLTENSLYTVEAWELFLDRLSADGILAVSRFYVPARPDEIYRLTALATAALSRRGITAPRDHILVVRQLAGAGAQTAPVGMATLLVSPAPFSGRDVDGVEAVAAEMRFDVVLSARHALDQTFATLASDPAPRALLARFPVNVAAPTDDSPFFFHTVRLRDALRRLWWPQTVDLDNINMTAVSVLGGLLISVVALTVLCILVPLLLTTERGALRSTTPLFVFFAAIGLGFMLVEISQMQRLIIFLGHPTYSLSVVLFALLVSSGLGSALSGRLGEPRRQGVAALAGLVVVLAVFGAFTPLAIGAWAGATTPVRILVATGILFPLGLLMGTAFPLGMRLASSRAAALTPWLWGINGATSVCASVLAVVIALSSSISTAFWTGAACYVVALLTFRWAGAGPAAGRTGV